MDISLELNTGAAAFDLRTSTQREVHGHNVVFLVLSGPSLVEKHV